mgnify:FL=1
MATTRYMDNDSGFRITGRMVLFCLIGFFGLISIANAIMIWLAVSSHTGVVVGSAYKAGGEYQSEIDTARAQAARAWAVEADVTRAGEGAALDVTIRDADGAPVFGLAVTVRLASNVTADADAVATLSEGEVGRYRGAFETVAPGSWTLMIDADRGDDRVYHSENRVMLR